MPEASTTIGRCYRFESAHFLPKVPEGHRCRNLHGHNYRVEVVVRGPIDTRGFVRDFAEVDADMAPLLALVDHKLLNDVDGLSNPTAERIAHWFLDRMPDCERVRVWENADCWAEVVRTANDTTS
ncbi:MAG: 6-carboxytetrahydropterin synthase QueD [Alphaproteobacteria bacterium]|nr:6-carboxytetrahydropterin synthase QueD [Alphaproteobacteria bacterium]